MKLRDLFKRESAIKPTLGEAAFADPYRMFAGGSGQQYNPSELVTRKGLWVFDQMRRDDQVKAAMSFKKHSVLAGGWDVMVPEGMPDDWEPKQIVEERLRKIAGGFENAMLSMLTALDYGYSVSERVWVDDGGAKLAAVKTRKPHEMEFLVDAYGNITGLEQAGRQLPMDKFIIYTYISEFSNHYGTSDLEAAYRPWWTKDNAYKWMAMLLERMGIPPIFALYNSDDYRGDQLSKLKTIMMRMQAATTGIIPRGTKDSLEMWSPELAGQVSTVFIPAMDMLNRDIARAILMPGLLGATPDAAEGSYARAEVHFDVFMLVIEHIRRELQELIQAQLVEHIVAVEIGPLEDSPRFEFRPLTDDVRIDLMDEWAKMVDADVVKRQADDERHIRKQLKFPDREASDEDFIETPVESVPNNQGRGTPAGLDGASDGGDDGQSRSNAKAGKARHYVLARQTHFAQVAERLDGVEADAKDQIKKTLIKARDEFIANIPSRLSAKGINALSFASTAQLKKAIAAMLQAAFEQGDGDVRTEVNPKAHGKALATPKDALKYLDQKAFWATGVLEDQLLKDAKNILMQALRSGEGTGETMIKIKSIWEPYVGSEVVKPARLETIVRTNTTDAYNNGRLTAMRDPDLEGFIHGVEYSAIIDERTTELCQHLDGKVFLPDDPDLDRFTPPNHFNCRSVLVPILVDETLDVGQMVTATDKGIALDLMDKGFGGSF